MTTAVFATVADDELAADVQATFVVAPTTPGAIVEEVKEATMATG